MEPKEILKNKILDKTGKNMTNSFFSRGRDYFVDELIIWRLYEIYKNNINDTNIYTYDDKKEIKKAYPGLFKFEQMETFYKVTKDSTSYRLEDKHM
tara:strand:- start:28 stop:315 length:288 start_codon:yes stop_codon:yes gene_type:complete